MSPKDRRAARTCELRQSSLSPAMFCQPAAPIVLRRVFSNSSTVVNGSFPPRHSGVTPAALRFFKASRNAGRLVGG